nr:hypothetical protein CFP56_07199 [Quercus suber]
MGQFTPHEFAMTEDSNGKTGSGVVLEVTEFLRLVQPHVDFQAVLQEIDEAIYGDNIFQKSNASDMELSLNQDGKMVLATCLEQSKVQSYRKEDCGITKAFGMARTATQLSKHYSGHEKHSC